MYSHIRLYRSRGISPDVSSWYAVDAAALHGLTYDLNQLAVSRTIVDDLLIRIGGAFSLANKLPGNNFKSTVDIHTQSVYLCVR